MVDEVEIVNVKGDEVASEETLLALLETMKRMAKSKGFDPAEVNKKTKDLADNLDKLKDFTLDNTKSLKDNTDAKDENTESIRRSSKVLSGLSYFGGGLLTSVAKLSRELLVGGDTLSAFSQHIPIIGSLVTPLASILDNAVESFRGISNVGIDFGESLFELRYAATQSGLSFDTFTNVIRENSETLALFGGSARAGAKIFSDVSKIVQRDFGPQFSALGMTMDQTAQFTADYLDLQRRLGRTQQMSQHQLAMGTGNYIMMLDSLSKITGKQREQIADSLQAQQQDAVVNALLSTLSGPAQNALRGVLTITEGMGPEFQGAIREMVATGGAPVSDFGRSLVAANPELARLSRGLRDGTVSQEQYMQAIRDAADVSANMSDEEKRSLATAAALGNEYARGRLALMQFTQIAENSSDVNQEQLEAMRRGSQGLLDFSRRITQLRNEIVGRLIETGVFQRLETAASGFVDMITGPAGSAAIGNAIDGMITFFENFITDIQTFGFSDTIANAFDNIFDAILDKIFGTTVESNTAERDADLQLVNSRLEELTNLRSQAVGGRDVGASVSDLDGQIQRLREQQQEINNRDVSATAGVFSADGFSSTLMSAATNGITSLWTDSGLIGKTAIAIGGLFVASRVVNAVTNGATGLMETIGGMFGGRDRALDLDRGSERRGPSRGSRTAGGRLGSNIGGALGGLTGGILEGVGNGLAAIGSKAPYVVAGAAAIGAAIPLIGAGIAGAAWIMGKALPTFAEGMESFEDIDGAALRDAAQGIFALSGAMAAFGTGSAVSGIGQMVGGITEFIGGLFGAEDPLEKLERFGNANIDAAKVEANARALAAMSAALAASGGATAASGLGDMVGGITGFLGKLFGAEDPMDKLKRFAKYDIDSERVIANANALTAFSRAMTFSSGASAASGIGDFVNGLVGGLGRLLGAEDPMDKLQRFSSYNIDSDRVNRNVTALTSFSEAMSNMPAIEQPGIFGSIRSSIASLFGGDNDAFAPLVAFSNIDLGRNAIINARALRSFSEAMSNMPEISQPGIFGTIRASIASLFGADNDAFAPLVAFSNLELGRDAITNISALTSFSEAMNQMPEISQPGIFGSIRSGIASLFGGDNDAFAPLVAFSNLELGNKVEQNSNALAAFSRAMNQMPEISQPGIFGSIRSGIASLFGGDNDAFAPLVAFSNLELGSKVNENSELMRTFAEAMNQMPVISQPGIFGSIRSSIASLFGGDNDAFAPLVAFSNLNLGSKVNENSELMRTFAEAMNQMPVIDEERAGGFFESIRSIFSGETVMPWDKVREFGEVDLNVDAVNANAEAMRAFGGALSRFSNFEVSELDIPNRFTNNLVTISNINGTGLDTIASGLERLVGVTGVRAQLDAINEGLDSTGIRTYSSAIDELIEKMNELNEVLAKSNDTLLRDNMSAAEVLGNINVSTQGSTEGITQLNTLLTQMLTILTESKEIEDKIERNTASLGNDTLFGRVSNIR